HRARLARGDAEEGGVERVHLRQERAVAGVHLPRGAGLRVVVALEVPAGGGDGGDGVPPLLQQLPEGVRRVGAAGEAAGHADDGDGLVRGGPGARRRFGDGGRGGGGQALGRLRDGGVVVERGGGDRPAQPHLQVAGEAHQVARLQAVVREGDAGVHLPRVHPAQLGHAGEEPGGDLRLGARLRGSGGGGDGGPGRFGRAGGG